MKASVGSDALLLVVHQQGSRYAVRADHVEEIITSPAITALPRQPEYLRGIFSYKGHIIPVFSLQALCGCGKGTDEVVCVVLRMDDLLLALTVDSAESLVTDAGSKAGYDGSLMDGELIKLDHVVSGDPAILVIDLERTYRAAESHLGFD